MSNSNQLANVVESFEQWRSTRNRRQARTPGTLREQAALLLNDHSSSKIISALKISGTQLKQWRTELGLTEPSPQFVALPTLSSLPNEQANVEFRFSNGDQLCLSGEICLNLLTAIIREIKS
jgi:hypothetical protein